MISIRIDLGTRNSVPDGPCTYRAQFCNVDGLERSLKASPPWNHDKVHLSYHRNLTAIRYTTYMPVQTNRSLSMHIEKGMVRITATCIG
jgi:hypothetical protein